jgi:hypothetical protein
MKLGGFWILCVDFAGMCVTFFKPVVVKAPPGMKCQGWCEGQTATLTTQCGHCFCELCIEKGRKVWAACPSCKSPLPRKWAMPLKYGMISNYVLGCVL